MSGKNQLNWNWRGSLWRCLVTNRLMHLKIKKYFKLTTNNQMPYKVSHALNVWNSLLKKKEVYTSYISHYLHNICKSTAYWFKNIKPISLILPCHIHMFRNKSPCLTSYLMLLVFCSKWAATYNIKF